MQGSSVSEAVAWALQPGSVAPEVRAELAPLVQAQEQAGGGAAPSLREMVWEVTKAPHCGLPGALINALYCAQTSSGWVGGRSGWALWRAGAGWGQGGAGTGRRAGPRRGGGTTASSASF